MNIDKCIEEVKQKIDNKKKEVKVLENLRSALWKQSHKEDKKFKCPLDKEDPLCPECDYALPKIHQGNDYISYTWPFEMDSSLKILKTKGCLKWKEKDIQSACGCGGTVFCICGYNYNYCMLPETPTCPFCGRGCKVEGSSMYNFMTLSDEQFKLLMK